MTAVARLQERCSLVLGLVLLCLLASTAGSTTDRAAAASCANQYFNATGNKWPGGTTAPYYTALDYVWPGGASGRNQVLQAHLNWNYTVNNCGQPDTSPYASWWGGGTCCWASGNRDGVSYRDVGAITGCSSAALACEYTYTRVYYPTAIVESDQRLNATSGYSWYWGAGSIGGGQYDLQSVMTHEAGHSAGLDHVTFPPVLVMYPGIIAGSTYQRSLGWGDYTGMQTIYP